MHHLPVDALGTRPKTLLHTHLAGQLIGLPSVLRLIDLSKQRAATELASYDREKWNQTHRHQLIARHPGHQESLGSLKHNLQLLLR